MIYEFRRDYTVGGKLGAYKSLVGETGTKMFARHEIEAAAYFNVVIGPGMADQFPYLLRWNSFDERTEKLAALENDPEWIEAIAEAEKDGPLLIDSTNQLWNPTYYSNLQ